MTRALPLLLVLVPLLGALLVGFTPERRGDSAPLWRTAQLVAILTLGLAIALLTQILTAPPNASLPAFDIAWFRIQTLSVHFGLAASGMTTLCAVVLAYIAFAATLSGGGHHEAADRTTVVAILATLGLGLLALLATDLLLFLLAWQACSLPLVFAVGRATGDDTRPRRFATVFGIATQAPLLLAVIWLLAQPVQGKLGQLVLESSLAAHAQAGRLSLPAQSWLLGAFALACLARLAIVPLHFAHVAAITSARAPAAAVVAATLPVLSLVTAFRVVAPLFPHAWRQAAPAAAIGCAVAGGVAGLLAWRGARNALLSAAWLAGIAVLALLDSAAARNAALLMVLLHGAGIALLILTSGARVNTRSLELAVIAFVGFAILSELQLPFAKHAIEFGLVGFGLLCAAVARTATKHTGTAGGQRVALVLLVLALVGMAFGNPVLRDAAKPTLERLTVLLGDGGVR